MIIPPRLHAVLAAREPSRQLFRGIGLYGLLCFGQVVYRRWQNLSNKRWPYGNYLQFQLGRRPKGALARMGEVAGRHRNGQKCVAGV